MPRLVVLEEQGVSVLREEPYLDEATLEGLLEEHPELIALDEVDPAALPLLPIGRQITLAGQSLDLLFLDASGRLTAVETKLRRNSEVRRTVVGQVLEYGAYLSKWSAEDVERQAEHYLADPKTPTRFRSQSLYQALSRLGTLESPVEAIDENDIRAKISNRIANFDMRLIIAVDRVLDPLRSLVTFTNSAASRFAMYLLEVQQYLAPGGLRIASIDVYGGSGPRPSGGGDGPTQWDETRFSDTLKDHASADASAVVQELYAFMQEQADSVVWGTGRVDGSAGFGVRRGGDRFVIFWVTTKGRVYFSAAGLNKRAQQEARALLATLRSSGIEAPDELLEGDHWPTFDAGRLKNPSDRKRFKSAVLAIRDAVTR